MEMIWKILGIKSPDGELITQAKYLVTASRDGQTVETEGHWYFHEPKLVVPFHEVTENMIIEWIKDQSMQDGINMIEKRLAEQLATLNKERATPLPWMPQVFTPEV